MTQRISRRVVRGGVWADRPGAPTTWQTYERLGGSVAGVTAKDWRPRYLQLAEQLRGQILSGDMPPGTLMPSETELADSSGLSRTSVRNAIRQLREWGLVRAEQGRGTYVRAPRQRVRRRNTERYQWEKDRVLLPEAERRATGGTEHDTGLTVDDLKFHAEYTRVPADAEMAAAFGVEPGTELLRRVYWTTTRSESAPLSVSYSFLPVALIAGNPDLLDAGNEPWPGGTQHQLYTVGIELDRIVDEIRARPPSPDEAELLDIDPGVSVLTVRKTSVDIGERVVEVADVVMPGDRTELVYSNTLTRWPA
ncbi:GntR family transcriptional regulator [Micromonospora sp. Llam0]|nr:GntR family transcriptional regulator [Micromonospora sp. Llam0]